MRTKGEKLTQTQRKLTPEQQEARALVQAGASYRQTAKMLGISRCAIEGLLNEPLRVVAQEYGVSHETIRCIILSVQKRRGKPEA